MDGRTGLLLSYKIFVAPVFYQCLKHMARPKMHARSSGKVDALTHQPTQGRSRDGGMRVGGMEIDGLISHGVCAFLKERTFDRSDAAQMHVDRRTGLLAETSRNGKEFEAGQDIVDVEVPHTFKLLMQELMGMGIMPQISVVSKGVP